VQDVHGAGGNVRRYRFSLRCSACSRSRGSPRNAMHSMHVAPTSRVALRASGGQVVRRPRSRRLSPMRRWGRTQEGVIRPVRTQYVLASSVTAHGSRLRGGDAAPSFLRKSPPSRGDGARAFRPLARRTPRGTRRTYSWLTTSRILPWAAKARCWSDELD
jgi:hypothetical protein